MNEEENKEKFSYYENGKKHSSLDKDGNYIELFEDGQLKSKTTDKETLFYDKEGNVTNREEHSDYYKQNPEALLLKNKIKFLLDCGDKETAYTELGTLCRWIAVPPQLQTRIADRDIDSKYPLLHLQKEGSCKRMQTVVLEDGKVALGEIYGEDKYVNHPINVANNGIEWMWRIRGSVIDVDKGELLWQNAADRSVSVRHSEDPSMDLKDIIVSDLVTVSDDDKKINFHIATGRVRYLPNGGKMLAGSEPKEIINSVDVNLDELAKKEQPTSTLFAEHLYDMRRLTDKSFNKKEIEKERKEKEIAAKIESISQKKENYKTEQRIKKQKMIDTMLGKRVH